jgi:hypothetical protein
MGIYAMLTRNSESVEAIIIDEVLDLVDASLTRVHYARSLACTIDSAAEVKTCDLFRDPGQICSKNNDEDWTHVGTCV